VAFHTTVAGGQVATLIDEPERRRAGGSRSGTPVPLRDDTSGLRRSHRLRRSPDEIDRDRVAGCADDWNDLDGIDRRAPQLLAESR
jgi:hypothetical protein